MCSACLTSLHEKIDETGPTPCYFRWYLFSPTSEEKESPKELRKRVRLATGLCETCPVLLECGIYALHHTSIRGVIAGEYRKQIRQGEVA